MIQMLDWLMPPTREGCELGEAGPRSVHSSRGWNSQGCKHCADALADVVADLTHDLDWLASGVVSSLLAETCRG